MSSLGRLMTSVEVKSLYWVGIILLVSFAVEAQSQRSDECLS